MKMTGSRWRSPLCLVAALVATDLPSPAATPALTYATYIGGSGLAGDSGAAVASDAAGNIYIAGSTTSANFPRTAGSFAGGSDAFVVKLNASGTAILYSRLLGGSGHDRALAVAVDAAGNAYVTGTTASADFPATAGALRTVAAGDLDAFAARLDVSGALVYATYLGGSGADAGRGIAVDGSEAVVAGFTESTDFPATSGALQPALRGAADAFVARLNAAGSGLIYATYLGGGGTDRANAVALDASGNAYVAGSTDSQDFPATSGAKQTALSGGADAFVAKVAANGASLLYATYLGGGGGDEASGIAVDGAGSAHVTGHTASSDFPATSGAARGVKSGGVDAFVARLNAAGSALTYSTFFGGFKSDLGRAIALDGSGNAHVAGVTRSVDFPAAGALQSRYAGADDAFVLVFSPAGSLLRSSYLGGTGADGAAGIVVNVSGEAIVTGFTDSANFPVSPNALQPAPAAGVSQAFLAIAGNTAAPVANLSLGAAVTPNPAARGSNVTYAFTITNQGSAAASSVKLTSVLPPALTFVSCTATAGGACQGSANNRAVTFTSLSAGASATATLVAKVGTSLPDGATFVNTASVTSAVPDPDRGNNYATASAIAVIAESIAAPLKPTGATAGIAGTTYTYTASGASSSAGHTLQYRFQWGDGSDSGWLPAGTRNAKKSWTAAGAYSVRAQARCATHIDNVSANSPALAVTIGYSISGRVTLAGGAALGSVTISLSGSKTASTATNSAGNYVINNLSAGGNYTIKPSKAGYIFTPASRSFSPLSANQTANFVATPVYKISGRIARANGTAIAAVTLTLSGTQSKTTQTDSSGNYSFTGLTAGNYTIKPSRSGFSFTPASRAYTGLNANKTGVNFTGKAN
ncbi:MAG: SBBP repeat-containing protein [Bryobacteraceae bacterium]|nr:SBBP repeat-containing protein [Bryobacteraceae bacterium]